MLFRLSCLRQNFNNTLIFLIFALSLEHQLGDDKRHLFWISVSNRII